MDINKTIGWLIAVYGGWSLLAGIVTNDMGGLASLGYNPDLPMSLGRAPFRFFVGIVINAAIIYYGRQLIVGNASLRR